MQALDTENNEQDERQYLMFSLEQERFGVEILRVKEIRGWGGVRAIPNTPEYLKGVLNLRGEMVPIVDLRHRFHISEPEYTPTTVVIVLSVNSDKGEFNMGVVVDAVSDVVTSYEQDIKAVPKINTQVDTRFLSGVIVIKEEMVLLLDVDKLLAPEELTTLASLES